MPGLIRGCRDDSLSCGTVTFYGFDAGGIEALGRLASGVTDHLGIGTIGLRPDTSLSFFPDNNFARWSLSDAGPGMVPEPGTAVFLGLRLLGLATRRKH